MANKKTKEQFMQELHLIIPEAELVGDYTNVNTKTSFKCLVHDCEFEAYPINMLHGHTGCKQCGKEKYTRARSKTQEQFIKDVEKVNPNIEVVGQYINAKTKVLVRCKIDGYIWNADPKKIMRGCQCSVCLNRTVMVGVNDIATTRPDLLLYFKHKEDAYKYTSGSEKYINVICPECGYEDSVRIANLSRFGFSCNGCYEDKYGHKRVPYGYWNKDTMEEYLKVNYNGYKLLDIQKPTDAGSKSLKALIKCPNEKHPPYWAYWKNITSGYMCLLCYTEDAMSKGERAAEVIFQNYHYTYEPQKKFDDCCDKLPLPFDFYLPEYNLVVEIMGEQHEHPVEYFGGYEAFEIRVCHDQIKRNYLRAHGIHCLDIWYYEFDKMEDLILNKIQEILNNTKLI